MTCGSGSVEVLRVGRTLQLVRFWNFSIFLGRGRTQPGIFTRLTEAVSDWVSREDGTETPLTICVVCGRVSRRSTGTISGLLFIASFLDPVSHGRRTVEER